MEVAYQFITEFWWSLTKKGDTNYSDDAEDYPQFDFQVPCHPKQDYDEVLMEEIESKKLQALKEEANDSKKEQEDQEMVDVSSLPQTSNNFAHE